MRHVKVTLVLARPFVDPKIGLFVGITLVVLFKTFYFAAVSSLGSRREPSSSSKN